MSEVYSYIRFSSEIQSKGDSLRRQRELSEKYCRDNGLVLNTSLNLTDLGVSAYKGNNAQTGALGRFIQAVESGVIKSGSILLVESLDRLSREKPLKALGQFSDLLDAGITIITLIDGQKYDAGNINNVDKLMLSIISMVRANEESAIKSKRVKAAWDKKHELAHSELKPLGNNCPAWLEYVCGKYQVKIGASETINRIYQLYIAGYGYRKILQVVDAEYPVFEYKTNRCAKNWTESRIQNLLADSKVIGEFRGIAGYYPAVISLSDYQQVQQLRANKVNVGGSKGVVSNLFAHLCKCGGCGGPMIRLNNPNKATSPTYNSASMVCDNGRKGRSSCGVKRWGMGSLEDKLLKSVTEVDLSNILGGENKDGLKILSAEISSLEYQIIDNTKQVNNAIDAIVSMGGNTALEVRLKQLELVGVELNDRLKLLKSDYQIELNKFSVAKVSQDNILILKDKLQDNDVRLKVNQEIRKIVSRIVLFNQSKQFVIEYKNAEVKLSVGDKVLDLYGEFPGAKSKLSGLTALKLGYKLP